jgi:hypothetical protein
MFNNIFFFINGNPGAWSELSRERK